MPTHARAGLPTRAALHPAGLYLALSDVAPADLQDPLMHHTVRRLQAPETLLHVPRRDLGAWREEDAPAGLIFHVGRCGSTLLSQLLKQHPGVVVYAEPLPVNELLTPPITRSSEEIVAALRSLAAAFRRHAGGPYVVKLSSWNTLFCELLTQAFPKSPWLFNYREPVEVAVPLVQSPPPWLRDGSPTAPAFRAMIDPASEASSPEALVSRLYGAFCEALLPLNPRHGRPLAYTDLPAAAWTLATPHFGLADDPAARARMAEAASSYAKAPVGQSVAFAPDETAKRSAASDSLRREVDRHARPPLARLLEKLETVRRKT